MKTVCGDAGKESREGEIPCRKKGEQK